MRAWVAASALALVGCGGAYQQAGSNIATGVIGAADTPAEQKKIDDTVSSAAKAGTQTLIDTGLSPDNRARFNQAAADMVTSAGTSARAQFDLLAGDLQTRAPQIVRLSLDEALLSPKSMEEVDALRERLFGAPLQADLQADGTALASALKSAVVSVRPAVDAEAAKWKPIAVGFGVGAGALLLTVIILVWTLHGHRQIIERLAASEKSR